MRGGARLVGRRQPGQAFFLLILIVLVLLPLLHPAAGESTPPTGIGKASNHSSGSLPPTWPSFDNGNVTYLFNGSFPALTVIEDANASIQAGLGLEHILEVAPYVPKVGRPGDSGPLGLLAKAYASPAGPAPFHVAVSGNVNSGKGMWVNMSNDVAVHSLSVPGLNGLPIWQSPDGEIPVSAIGGVTGSVNVTVSFHILGKAGTVGQVAVSLFVAGWPWISASTDALALEWQFFAPSVLSAQDVTCSTPLAIGNSSPAPCGGGTTLQIGKAVWTNTSIAVESVSQTNLYSFLEWPDSGLVTTSAGQTVMPLNAALFPISGSNLVRMMQVTEAGAGAVVNFTEDPTLGLLLPPTLSSLPSLPFEVQGYAIPFLATVAATTAIMFVIREARHRRDAERLHNL